MIPDDDTIDFLFHASRWWLSEFGGFAVFRAETGVLLPVDAHFPVPPELEGQARAEALFACVAHHCGVVDWPWQLDAEAPPSVADALAGMAHHMTAAPTGGESQPIDDDGPLPVPYDPAMVANPTALVADFARAVSHYYLYDAQSELPVEDEDREYVVDLSAGLLGFGVFQASSAFEFGQHEAGMMVGWGTTRRGAAAC